MRHALPPRMSPRHAPRSHRPRPVPRARYAAQEPVRTSDLVLALLAVAVLGALGLIAATNLLGRALAP